MKYNDESYAAFQDSIFREIHDRKIKYVASELIKLAANAGISQRELIPIISSSQTGDDILDAIHARISDKNKRGT